MKNKRKMLGDCSDCQSRWFCKKLCPAAEAYANQDYVGRRELPVGLPTPRPHPTVKLPTKLTDKERKIVWLLGQGLSRGDVCQVLAMSGSTLRRHLSNIKKRFVDDAPIVKSPRDIEAPKGLTKMQSKIFTLSSRGLSNEEICEVLNIKRNTLTSHLYNMRKIDLKFDDFDVIVGRSSFLN